MWTSPRKRGLGAQSQDSECAPLIGQDLSLSPTEAFAVPAGGVVFSRDPRPDTFSLAEGTVGCRQQQREYHVLKPRLKGKEIEAYPSEKVGTLKRITTISNELFCMSASSCFLTLAC